MIRPHDHDQDAAADEILDLVEAIEPQDEEARSSASAYLGEIGYIGLLGAREEWALAERIQAGDADARRRLIRAHRCAG